MLEWRTVGRSWSAGAELVANFRSCEPVGVYGLELGGPAGWCEVLISRHFTPTGKTQEVPASRLRTSSRTQQVLHSEAKRRQA